MPSYIVFLVASRPGYFLNTCFAMMLLLFLALSLSGHCDFLESCSLGIEARAFHAGVFGCLSHLFIFSFSSSPLHPSLYLIPSFNLVYLFNPTLDLQSSPYLNLLILI